MLPYPGVTTSQLYTSVASVFTFLNEDFCLLRPRVNHHDLIRHNLHILAVVLVLSIADAKKFWTKLVPKHPKLPKNLPILEQIEYLYSEKLPLRAKNGRLMAILAVKKREKQGKKTASIAAFLAGLNRREEQGKNQEIKIQSPTAVSLTRQGLQLSIIRLRGMRQGRDARTKPLPKKLAHMTPKSFGKFLGNPWV